MTKIPISLKIKLFVSIGLDRKISTYRKFYYKKIYKLKKALASIDQDPKMIDKSGIIRKEIYDIEAEWESLLSGKLKHTQKEPLKNQIILGLMLIIFGVFLPIALTIEIIKKAKSKVIAAK